jgi:hypothetical protein
LIFLFVLVYVYSLAVHAADGPASRVIASVYNLSYWVMGFFLMLVVSNFFSLEKIQDMAGVLFPLAWSIAFLFFMMLFLSSRGHIEFSVPTPLYWMGDILGNTALVQESVSMTLLVYDWFNEVTRPRFNALSPYATATAALIMLVLIMTIVRALFGKKVKSPTVFFLSTVNFFALLLTLSRTTVIAFGAGFVAVAILRKKEPFLWFLAFLVVLVLSYPLLEQGLSWILGLRIGSTTARFDLYRISLEQLDGIDWLFGVGLKPRMEDSLYPLGSHSTYLSLLFRTGFIVMLLMEGLQINFLWQWFRLKSLVVNDREQFIFWIGLGWILISMNFWILTEDLDAPQLLAFIYFSIVGMFEGFRREVIRHARSAHAFS